MYLGSRINIIKTFRLLSMQCVRVWKSQGTLRQPNLYFFVYQPIDYWIFYLPNSLNFTMNKILVTRNSIRVNLFKVRLYYKEQKRHVKKKEEHGCIKSVSKEEMSGPDIDASRLSQGNVVDKIEEGWSCHRVYIKSYAHLFFLSFFLCMHLSPLFCNFSPLCFPTNNSYLHVYSSLGD